MPKVQVVSIRMVREREISYGGKSIRNAIQCVRLFREILGELDREACWVACFDCKMSLTCLSQVSLGSLNSSDAHPREVYKIAVLANAHAIVIAHNHPSGNPRPSVDDNLATGRLQRAGKALGIELKDHLIIAGRTYFSYADAGRL